MFSFLIIGVLLNPVQFSIKWLLLRYSVHAIITGKPMKGDAATKQWYDEIKDFDFDNKTFHQKTGHFTQAIWKGSVELGAGSSSNAQGWNFCVARYAPNGNIKGKYEENIGNLDQMENHFRKKIWIH